MSHGFWRRVGLPALALLALMAAPVGAQTKTNFVIRGPVAAVNWTGGLVGPVDVDLTVLAFSDLAPAQGNQPAPGPYVAFSATRLSALGGTLIRRQWYGNAPIPLGALSFGPNLSEAYLNIEEVPGVFEEQIGNREPTRRAVTGRIEIRWVATAALANTTLSLNRQETPFGVQFDAAGQGREAQATVNVTVEGLGGPIQATGPGTLLAPAAGLFTLGLP